MTRRRICKGGKPIKYEHNSRLKRIVVDSYHQSERGREWTVGRVNDEVYIMKHSRYLVLSTAKQKYRIEATADHNVQTNAGGKVYRHK